MKNTLKNLFLILAVIAITAAFSGCGMKNGNEIEKLGNSEIEEKNGNATSTDDTATTTDGNAEDTATTTDEIDTSDWKVYRNEEYGYIIKYPKNWAVFDNNPYIPIHSSVQFNHSVSKTEGVAFRINIPEYGHGAESYEIISVESFQLSGIEAQKILRKKSEQLNTEMGNENIIYISFHDKKFNYESGIEFIYSDVNQKYYKDVFNKMLDSLQFTN